VSELVAIAYPSDSIAPAVVDRIQRLADEDLIDVEDLVFMTRGPDGTTRVEHPLSKTGSSANVGGVVGLLAGFMLLNPVAGAAVGAGAGAISAKLRNTGIDGDFVDELAVELQPGTSALLALVRSVDRQRVVPEVAKYGGRLLHTTLSADAEQRLREDLERR
jgi:uncharacterized membrane protein